MIILLLIVLFAVIGVKNHYFSVVLEKVSGANGTLL